MKCSPMYFLWEIGNLSKHGKTQNLKFLANSSEVNSPSKISPERSYTEVGFYIPKHVVQQLVEDSVNNDFNVGGF